MVARNVFMKNFPVISVKAVEGTLTRYTGAVTPTGGVAEGAAVYSAAISKGSLVVAKDHTTNGLILVERVAANGEITHGIAVSEPSGIDNTTVSGQTPVAALRRTVDVAFFGLGVIELTASATGAVAPGDVVGMDADEINEVETQILAAAVATGDQGKIIALSYAAAGYKVSLLVGASMFVGN